MTKTDCFFFKRREKRGKLKMYITKSGTVKAKGNFYFKYDTELYTIGN